MSSGLLKNYLQPIRLQLIVVVWNSETKLNDYGMKLKKLIEKNMRELDALKNQHICWSTVICYR